MMRIKHQLQSLLNLPCTIMLQRARSLKNSSDSFNGIKRVEMKSGNKAIKEFVYNDKGSMATVGRNLAVVDVPKPKLHFGGFFAWMIWMGLHLMLILGVKNRFFVFSNWLYNYFTYDQNLRLIFKQFYREKK